MDLYRRQRQVLGDLGVLDRLRPRVDVDLQLHRVSAGRRADQPDADRRVVLVERAAVARVLVIVDDLGVYDMRAPQLGIPSVPDRFDVDPSLRHSPQRAQFLSRRTSPTMRSTA